MTDRNQNRPGYKKTKAGWIPEEWKSSRFDEVSIVNPKRSMKLPACISFVGMADVSECGVIQNQTVKQVKDGINGFTPFIENDILVAKITPCFENYKGAMAVGLVNGVGFGSTEFHVIRPLDIDRNFIFYHTRTHRFRVSGVSNMVGSAGQKRVPAEFIQKYIIPLPPLPEQKQITEILSTWDEAIEQTRQLIAAANRRKKALMQKLLTGKKRLKGFKGKWTSKRLSVITERITSITEHPENYPVLSITAGTGFVSQADKFSRVIAGKHIENYVLLKRGEFSYNKGNSYRYPQGCVYQLHEYNEGLVPDVFYSFRLNPAFAHDGFIKQFFIAGLHNRKLYRCVNTGVRNNGLLNLNADDFFSLEIKLPNLDEQRIIAAVLQTADEEIAVLESKLAALEKQKRGLMQKLLTGEVRLIFGTETIQ